MSTFRRAFVTGATGLVGTHLVRRLHKDGYAVRALVLPGEPKSSIEGLDVDVVQGNMLEPATLKGAMDGCDCLFHVAGCTDEWASDEQRIYDLNVLGTRHVMREALATESIRRVCYTSTCAAVGGVDDPSQVADEETVWNFQHVPSPYFHSKLLAEKEAMQWALRGLDMVTVNPNQVIGAWDSKPSPMGQIILDFCQGRLPAITDAYTNWVDARALAWGQVAALEKGRSGERYILAGKTQHLRDVVALLRDITGKPMPTVTVPQPTIEAASHLFQWVADNVTHQHPPLTLGMARVLRKPVIVSSEKARRELGFDPPPIREAVERAIAWFRENGYL